MSLEKLRQYELLLLSALVVVMPSLEALKTFFWFSFLVIFLVRAYREDRLSLIPVKTANIAASLYLSVTLISTLVNWPYDNGMKGFLDEFRYVTLFLCLASAGYSHKEYRQIALLIVVGALGGLVYGLVDFLFQFRTDFQFHSAGILTQSSIYLSMTILVNAGLLLDKQQESSRFKNLLRAGLLIQVIALVYMGSRGSLLAISLTFILFATLSLQIKTVVVWLTGISLLILLMFSLVQMFPDSGFSKDLTTQYSIERIQTSDSQRIEAWGLAFAKLARGKDLVWGIGPRNYKALNDAEFVRQNEKLLHMKKYSHAHNLFLTQLIEQGVTGLLAMIFLFTVFLQKVISVWRVDPDRSPGWAWYGGVGSLAIPFIAGMFNTPFYQEHAMLAMLLMGILFASGNATPKKSD